MSLQVPLEASRLSDDVEVGSPGRALRLLWLAFLLYFFIQFGLAWDRRWHTTNRFDDFFSPPHLFTYTFVFFTSATLLYIAYDRKTRTCFGPGFLVPLIRFPLPGAILFVLSGVLMTGAAGVADWAWHTRYGLNETSFSFPHALLGFSLVMTFLGLISCRLALSYYRPIGQLTLLIFSMVVMAFSTVLMARMDGNGTVEYLTRSLTQHTILAQDPNVQKILRLYVAWNLTRTHPLFLPLSGFAYGVTLATAYALTGRRMGLTLLAATLITILGLLGGFGRASAFGLAADARHWLPLPFLPSLLAFAVLRRIRLGERWSWLLAGLVYGIFVAGIWGPTRLGLFGAPAMLLGSMIGRRLYQTIGKPNRKNVIVLDVAVVITTLTFGFFDLYVRRTTP